MNNIPKLSDSEFVLFQKLIIDESGLCFDRERDRTLSQAVLERMAARKCATAREYYDLLKYRSDGHGEMRVLFDLLTINETYFFRNRTHFNALRKTILPDIIRRKIDSSDRSIQIWSAGCSYGAEAYSMAMVLMEDLPFFEEWNISILGTDISEEALTIAEEAVYGERMLRRVPAEYRTKYFTQKGSNYVLRDEVKEKVRFVYHNMAKDPFVLPGMRDLDVLFCRNVTIYFNFATTKRIIESFYDCMDRNGYLFLGHAESLWQMTDKFEMITLPQTVVYKKTSDHHVEKRPFIAVPYSGNTDIVSLESKMKVPGIEVPDAEKERVSGNDLAAAGKETFDEKWYDEVLMVLDEHLSKNEDDQGSRMAKAAILSNQGNFDGSIDELKKVVAAENLHEEAYYLLGVLFYKTGNTEEAERQFRKVIYIKPEIELAYFNLGKIYLYQRKMDLAGKEFRNTIKLLKKKSPEESIRFGEAFTVDTLMRACKNNLEEIENNGGM